MSESKGEREQCPECAGSGQRGGYDHVGGVVGESLRDCQVCLGSGKVVAPSDTKEGEPISLLQKEVAELLRETEGDVSPSLGQIARLRDAWLKTQVALPRNDGAPQLTEEVFDDLCDKASDERGCEMDAVRIEINKWLASPPGNNVGLLKLVHEAIDISEYKKADPVKWQNDLLREWAARAKVALKLHSFERVGLLDEALERLRGWEAAAREARSLRLSVTVEAFVSLISLIERARVPEEPEQTLEILADLGHGESVAIPKDVLERLTAQTQRKGHE